MKEKDPVSTPQPRPRTAHDVHVQVVNLLTALAPVVDHDAETAIRVRVATLFRGQLGGQGHHVAHQGGMFRGQMHHGRDVQLGDDQKMNGRPRRDVVEGEHMVVFMDFARGNFARDDFAKNTVVVGHGSIGFKFKKCQSVTGRCPFRRTMPCTMRYRNQMEIATQANQPGKTKKNQSGAVTRYNKAAQITVRMR